MIDKNKTIAADREYTREEMREACRNNYQAGLLAGLRRVEENGKAMRDVLASIAAQNSSAETIRAALRLLVRAYDEALNV